MLGLLPLLLKDLKSSGVRGVLVILGVVIGAASLVAFVSQAEGFKELVRIQFQGIVQKSIIGVGFIKPSLLGAISKFQGVERVIGIHAVDANVMGKKFKLVGMNPDFFHELLPLATPKCGKIDLEGPLSAVVGWEVASKLHLSVGMIVPVMAKGKILYVRVVGILSPVGTSSITLGFQPDKSVFLNKKYIEFIGIRNYQIIYIIMKNSNYVEKEFKKIKSFLESKGVLVYAPLTTIKAYLSAVKFAEAFLFAISAIALFVAGLGITNTLMMTVMERTKEIGLMKAIGFTNAQILLYYLMLASLYGIVGGVLGLCVGWFMANTVSEYMKIVGKTFEQYALKYFNLTLPSAYVTPYLMLRAFLFSVLVSALAGVYPAYKASKLDPVHALRSE